MARQFGTVIFVMPKTYEAEVLEEVAPGLVKARVAGKEATVSVPLNHLSPGKQGDKIKVEEHERHGFVQLPSK